MSLQGDDEADTCAATRDLPVGAPAPLRIDIVTLFPQLFYSWMSQGVVSRAVEKGIAGVQFVDIRPFGIGRHLVTDDYPFGGGPGMVMKPEPLFGAIESLQLDSDTPVILLSPAGRRFDQRAAHQLARLSRFVLVAGHYEGVDERVRQHLITEELSIGDYILSSGELGAMVVSDAVVRLLPGALGESSTVEESFAGSLLEYPQYTRPATFRGWSVPDVLVSGNHGKIQQWRRREAVRRTVLSRPDLLEFADLTPEEESVARELRASDVPE